jgi:hypothetical protein
MWPAHWDEHPITKITTKRIFVRRDRSNAGDQYSFDRAKVEAEGGAWFHNGTATKWFYSEAGKAEEEERREELRREVKARGRAALNEWCEVLGLGETYTRADVMIAFRRGAQDHHPDKGGDPTGNVPAPRRS